MDKPSDEELFIKLRTSSKIERNVALKRVYTDCYPVILSFIKNNNGSEEEATDIFQDAIIVFYEKVRLGELELSCSIQTYLYSICKNLWLNRLRSKKRLTNIDDQMQSIPVSEDSLKVLHTSERQNILVALIGKLGEDCKKVLTHYYFDRFRMREIAEVMGLANEQVAKNKKSGCMKKLKSMVSDSPELQNILR